MANVSGIKKVEEFIRTEEFTIYDVPKGGRQKSVSLEKGRCYIVPGYQREIRWSTENVQILIDDLKQGAKFLGTITLSTSEPGKFEIIDGQQRITVITLMVYYLNKYVAEDHKVKDLCEIYNQSFKHFNETLRYGFDYKEIEQKNVTLFNDIVCSDNQNQRYIFKRIWDSVVERISSLTLDEKEKLLLALLESELNIIVNEIEGTDTQRKFCVDYFIDINNKSVDLDSLDIIRAYAFKDNFITTTSFWTEIQEKCSQLFQKVKYTRDDLYYHYFICNVNKEIEYKITKLSNDYKTKEDVQVAGRKYASGTFIWNMFKNDSFYSMLLTNLLDYLHFIELVISTETGGIDEFKKMFIAVDGAVDETRILNTHTIINSILRNDDVVPKMMVMKFYFEVLKPTAEKKKKKNYKVIDWIGVVANVFTMSTKRKGSELIAGKLLQENWEKALVEYGKKVYKDVPEEIDFGKVYRDNGSVTKESGQYMARRYFSMRDACAADKVDQDVFKNENITTGDKNIEHFIINREYSYMLYLDDGSTVECEVKLPVKHRKNIASIANYLILNSDVNRNLRNRTAFEKIEMLEKEITKKGVNAVIPSSICQRHYYLIKKVMYDESTYPKRALIEAKKKSDKEELLRNYYKNNFGDEFISVAEGLSNEDKLFTAEKEYELKKIGFSGDRMEMESDTQFANVCADVDAKNRCIEVSAELYNPVYGEEENNTDFYSRLIDHVVALFKDKMGIIPEIHSSNEYGGSDDESFTFSLCLNDQIDTVIKFINTLEEISGEIVEFS